MAALVIAEFSLFHSFFVMLLGPKSSCWVWLILVTVGVMALTVLVRHAQQRAIHRAGEQEILDFIAEHLREQQ
jgi:hypothetical protein